MHDEINGPHSAGQTHESLRIVKPTDLRDFEDWVNDEPFCQGFLMDRPSTWRIAVQRYWRDRVTRRQLATELGQELETTKNLLRAIRKAAKDFLSGKPPRRKHAVETQWPRRPHTEINQHDILAICEGDPEAIAHAEEYRRLSILNQLSLFSPAISGELVNVFGQSDAVEETGREEIVARLIAEADELKASAAKDDPFAGRPLVQPFTDARTEYHADRRGRPRKQKPITPKRGPRKVADISDLRIIPIPPPIFLDGPLSHF